MKILGLDPGETTGWALLEVSDAGRVLDHGIIAAVVGENIKASEAEILAVTRARVYAMLVTLKADGLDVVAVEAPIHGGKFIDDLTNEVRGVCKEACAAAGVGWELVACNTAAKALTGSGRATKDKVRVAVEERFGLEGLSYHEADAVAVAVALARTR